MVEPLDSLSRKWMYVEPAEDGVSPVYTTLTEKEILERYWNYVYNRVLEIKGKEIANALTEQDCIEDFVVVHWAWPADLK